MNYLKQNLSKEDLTILLSWYNIELVKAFYQKEGQQGIKYMVRRIKLKGLDYFAERGIKP